MQRELTTRAGRLLMALPFILGGWDALREPGSREQEVAAAGLPQPKMAVRVNGLMMVLAGTGLAFGRLPRRAAAVLALILVPTTLVGHAFWREHDPQRRTAQLTHFLKNLSMIGGLMMVPTTRQKEGESSLFALAKRRLVKQPA